MSTPALWEPLSISLRESESTWTTSEAKRFWQKYIELLKIMGADPLSSLCNVDLVWSKSLRSTSLLLITLILSSLPFSLLFMPLPFASIYQVLSCFSFLPVMPLSASCFFPVQSWDTAIHSRFNEVRKGEVWTTVSTAHLTGRTSQRECILTKTKH